MPGPIYATVFFGNYADRAAVLYESYRRCHGQGSFAFCCLDDAAVDAARALAGPDAIVLTDTECDMAELAALKTERGMGEYSWTVKGPFLQLLGRRSDWASWLVYLDADMMVFGDLDELLARNENASFLLTSHDFSPDFEFHEKNVGEFNAGVVAFNGADARGRQALNWWTERCLESCAVDYTLGLCGDQKYLDAMWREFEGGVRLGGAGVNVAPWNIQRHAPDWRDGRVYAGEVPLLVYHFQGLRFLGDSLVDLYSGRLRLSRRAIETIYLPYLARLANVRARLTAAGHDCVDPPPASGRGSLLVDCLRLCRRRLAVARHGEGNPHLWRHSA